MARVMSWGLLLLLGAGGMFLFQRYADRVPFLSSANPPPPAETGGTDGGAPSLIAGEPGAEFVPPSPVFELGDGALPAELTVPIGELVPSAAAEIDGGVPGVKPGEALSADATAPSDADATFEAILARYQAPSATEDVLVLGGEEELGAGEGDGADVADQGESSPNPLVGADRTEFQKVFDEAGRAFDDSDTEEGLRLYRQIFDAGRDRDDLRVTVVARRLLESGPRESLAYHRYLARYEPDPARRYRSALAAGLELVDGKKSSEVRAAWELLSKAYVAAANADERRPVLDSLEPFVRRHIFTRRASPLLYRYRVQPGDSLAVIARDHQTTTDAIRRLNGLTNDVIRVGQSLKILSGSALIYINKSEFRLALFINGKLLFEKPIGTGADDLTPEGRFVIAERQKHPAWYRPGEEPIPAGDPRNILGSRWLGFEDTDVANGIGIHGTPDTSSIGKALSSGCIRLTNEDVEELFDFVPRRARVIIEG